MKFKTARTLKCLSLVQFFVLTVLFFYTDKVIAQTVTNVFPTRVTTSSKITIIGTGFTTANINNIYIVGINIGSRTLVSSTEVTCIVTRNNTGISGDNNGTLTMSGATIDSGVDTSFEYVGPSSKSVTNSSTYRVLEVYTNWDQNNDGIGFWKSSDFNSGDTSTWPNDSHELLGFKMNYGSNDIIFSTGVNDALLETELASLGVDVSATSTEYVSQDFKAYSTNGVSGKPNSNNYMGFADKIDGSTGSIVLNNAVRKTVYDVIIDGDKGLDLGTGIANFNSQADIRFYSGNGDIGAVNDGTPDLLITQIAQPGGSDVYYYADVDGNVVGRPIKLAFVNNNNNRLYQWKVDFYRLDYSSGSTFETAIPTTASFGNGQTRGFRMAAFNLEDFGIDGSSSGDIEDIDNINMGAGGSSDMAFIAYNKAAFDIKSPIINESPISRFVCRLPTISSLVFNVDGYVEAPTSDTKETIHYKWFKNNIDLLNDDSNTLTVEAGLTEADLVDVSYRVRVENGYGALDIPFTINKGGTPSYWDGSNWVLPTIYNDIIINDEDRHLIFSDDYNETIDLVGCDCVVPAGKSVIIPSESTLTLYNEITVEPAIPAGFDGDGNATNALPAGSFILENNASLVQINDVINSGEIKVERTVNNLHAYDYVYWSSPVLNFNISNIPGDLKYEWHTNDTNANGTLGNWATASGTMPIGRGFIARAPSATSFTTTFSGLPNNGNIPWTVYKTNSGTQDANDKHWNLTGNPYPSALNANKFLADNTTIEGSVYVWMHNVEVSVVENQPFYENFAVNYGNQYVTWNHLGGSDPSDDFDGNIASGQAFFVQVLEGSAGTSSTINFTNDMRYDINENSFNNSQFYRSSNEEEQSIESEKQLVWLSLANENNTASSTLIGYADGATEGKDRLFDAYTNNTGLNLYSLTSLNEKLAIQGLPLPFIETNTVPLGYNLTENGIYKIAIGNVKGSLFVDQGQSIYIEDTYSGVIHNLRASPYTFLGEEGVSNDRFVLRYTSSSLSTSDINNSNTFAYIKDGMLNVKSESNIKAITVYDLNGKEVVFYKSKGQIRNINQSFQFSKGLYLVSITLEGNILVTKKIIN
ncbi:T9SS type A sorting domain-containing protein [Winogradskyella sp. Asnod2-B02-A]|uniref:T9SS type A sorting domain-containing protein n=1 Tax=Winogradskyella sp. Asnod2-B02-A TaxID=3160583 RepID=UPI00386F1915